MKIILVILNLLAALLVGPAVTVVRLEYDLDVGMTYTELDRAGVIDLAQLEKKYPEEWQQGNRTSIPKLYVGSQRVEGSVGRYFFFVFLMNALLIGKTVKTRLVILNLLAALLVFPAMATLRAEHVENVAMMYAELDRAEVIDRAQYEKMYPKEPTNDRYAILAPKHREWYVGLPCLLGFLVNALSIGLFTPGNRKAEPSPGPHGSPAAGSPSEQA